MDQEINCNSQTSTDFQASSWSWKRFQQLIKLSSKLHIKSVGLKAGVLFVVTAVLLVLCSPSDTPDKVELGIKCVAFLFLATLAFLFAIVLGVMEAGRAFKDYNSRESGWLAVLLPASRPEKFWSCFMWSAILVPLIYLLASGIAISIPFMVNSNLSLDAFDIPSNIRSMFTLETSVIILALLSAVTGWIASQSVFFAGSAIFKTHPFLWTTIIVIAFGMISSNLSAMGVELAPDKVLSNTMVQELSDSATASSLVSIGFNVVEAAIALVVGWFFYRKRTTLS